VEALKADYWKPIQAGFPKDTDIVRQLVSNKSTKFHKEVYVLNTPASPHAAAEIDGVLIDLREINMPCTEKNLIIEGAGGLMVPLNDQDFVIDIAKKMNCGVVLVCNMYLGSINHSLLSLSYLKAQNIAIKGIVFNGPGNPASEEIILKYAQAPCLLNIEQEKEINKEVVKHYAVQLKKNLNDE